MKPTTDQPKPKKITVSLFLNKHVQPTGTKTYGNGNDRDAYPLYIAVIYNSRNTQFKSNYAMPYSDLNEVEPGLIEFEKRLITKILRFEISKQNGNLEYDLKGLKKKYDMYSHSLFTSLEKYLRPKLRLEILKTKDDLYKELHLKEGSVKGLYKAAGKLFDNFYENMDKGVRGEIELFEKLLPLLRVGNYEFPTIIDWMDGSFSDELKTSLSKGNEQSGELIDRSIKLITDAVGRTKKELEQ